MTRSRDELGSFSAELVAVEVPVPKWLHNAFRAAGSSLPESVAASIPSRSIAEAPAVLQVSFDAGPLFQQQHPQFARLLPSKRPPLQVRRCGDRLFAPFRPVGGIDDPYTLRCGKDPLVQVPITPSHFAEVLGIASHDTFNPFLLPPPTEHLPELQRSPTDPRLISSLMQGCSVEERIRHQALHATAFIGGVLHIAVFDPVWRLLKINEEPHCHKAKAVLCLPIDEAYKGSISVRFDHSAEAAAFFPACVRRPQDRPHPALEFAGHADVIGDYTPSRDDALCTALDTARVMLAETSELASHLPSEALIARTVLSCEERSEEPAPDRLFAACDAFADRLAAADRSLANAARRAHRLSQERRAYLARMAVAEIRA